MIDIMIAKVGKRFEKIKPITLKNFNIIDDIDIMTYKKYFLMLPCI